MGSEPVIGIPAGIVIGLVASLVQSLGLTIQRKSHVQNQEAPEEDQRKEYRRPLWLLGFGIFITSNILGSIFQIASLPVVILAPLGAVSLLWNALFARLILGDLFSRFMVIGTVLIIVGAVLIARFGIVPEPTHSLEDLLALFARDAFVIYFSLLGLVLVLALAVTHFVEWSTYRTLKSDGRFLSSPASSSGTSTPIPLNRTSFADIHPTERTPLLPGDAKTRSLAPSTTSLRVSPLQKYRSRFVLLAVSYASASGILSGMCLIFAKSGIELLLLTVTGNNQFWRWESWVLLLGLLICALLQLWYLHKSLILADPTLVCPLAFCFYNISSIFNGLIYYDQLSLLSPLQVGLVATGIFVLLFGVWAVSIQSDDEDAGEGTREGDWIPADEAGVAPAVAPADIVRIAERATGTLPSGSLLSPDTDTDVIRESQTSPKSSPTQTSFFPHSPSTPPPKPSEHRRTRTSHSQLPALSPPIPTLTSILNPEAHSPVLPGFSIGISAASPGFIAGTRRRDYPGLSIGIPTARMGRRAVSDGANVWRRDESSSPGVHAHRRFSSAVEDNERAPSPDPSQQPAPTEDGWLRRLFRLNVGQ